MTTEALFVVFEGAWVLGAIACKVLLYVQTITLASTTFILVAMSCDRFLAICRPLSLPGSRARKSIIFAWTMSLVFASPQLFIFKEVPDGIYPDGEIKLYCKSRGYTAWWQRKLYITTMSSYILVIPTIIISYCYINVVRVVWRQGKELSAGSGVTLRRTTSRSIPKAKIKTVKMTLSIILSFIMCWTPYFVVHLIHVWSDYQYNIPVTVYVFAETIALLNSALNPILYGCFNIKLKRGLMEIFCPDRLRTEVNHSFTTHAQTAVDYHCMNVVKNSARCTERASSSSTSSHRGDRDIPNGGRVKETVVDTGDGKNGYKLRVRFFKNGDDKCDVVCPGQNKALLSEYFGKEQR
jgi:neuropeptide S receptor 1